MKKLRIIFCFIIFICNVFAVKAQIKKEDLLGQWIFSYQESLSYMSKESKAYYNSMSLVRKKKVEDMYDNRIVSFLENNVFIQKLPNGITKQASWFLENNRIKLLTSVDTELIFEVQDLQNNQLVLKLFSSDVNTGMKALFETWCLIKN